MVETDLEALEDVRPLLGALEVEPRAPQDDVAPVLDEQLQRLLEAQHDRSPLDDREHDHAERRLQGGVLVEIVQDAEHLRLALQLDHDAHAVAVGLIAEVGDTFELSLRDQLGDLGHKRRLVDRIWELVDDYPLAAVRRLFERMSRAHDDASVASRVSGLDAGGAHDQAAGRKVRAFDEAQEVLRRRLRVVDEVLDGARNLAQVVRGDVRRHADGDAGRAVDQQVGHAGREHRRLLL